MGLLLRIDSPRWIVWALPFTKETAVNTIPFNAVKNFAAALVAVGGLVFFSSGALAADPQSKASNQTKYEQDVADCKSGKGEQDPAACMREAGAARDAANREALGTSSDDELQRNAMARCNQLPQAERPDCVAKMSSPDTTVSGSVQSGGILREKTIPVPVGTPGSTIQGTTPSR